MQHLTKICIYKSYNCS